MPVNSYFQAVIHEAVQNFNHPESPNIQHLLTGKQDAVWITPELSHLSGTDSKATNALWLALCKQGARYNADGLEISAGDCMYLMAKIRKGEIKVIENYNS